MTASSNYRFAGFISYSQKDKRWAKRLHKALESYRLPVGVPQSLLNSSGTTASSDSARRLGRFFRDDDELAGAPSLGAALTGALDDSRTLVVVCSPNSARSKWVDEEIRHFRSRGPQARVICVIVEGKPDSDDPEEMCFAPSLLRQVNADGELTEESDEPLAPDVSKEPFDRIVARVVAGILGVAFDTLWQRELRRKRKRQVLTAGAGLVLIALAAATGWQLQQKERARLWQQSLSLAAQAQEAVEQGRPDDALRLAMAALPQSLSDPQRPMVPEAQMALRRVMGGNLSGGVFARFEQGVTALKQLSDGALAAQLADGSIAVLNTKPGADYGRERLRLPPKPRLQFGVGDLAVSARSDERAIDGEQSLAIQHQVRVFDLTNGKRSRSLQMRDDDWFIGAFDSVSPSGRYVLVSASLQAGLGQGDDLAIWRVPEGEGKHQAERVGRIDGPAGERINGGSDSEEPIQYQSAFIDDKHVLIAWGEARRQAVIWDVDKGQVQRLNNGNGKAFDCAGQLDADGTRRDQLRLSANRAFVFHAQPILDGGWCVSLWRSRDGLSVAPFTLKRERFGDLDVLDEDHLLLVKHWRDFAPPSGIVTRGSSAISELDCDRPLGSTLSLINGDGERLLSRDRQLSVCAEDQQLRLAYGPKLNQQQGLLGHSQRIRSLAFDEGSRRLYSGSDDGQIRLWELQRLPRQPRLAGRGLAIAPAGEDSVYLLQQSPDEQALVVQRFLADGLAQGPLIRFALHGLDPAHRVQGRLKASLLAVGPQRLLLMESWNCGAFRACAPGTPQRALLVDAASAEVLAELGPLRGGKFLARTPFSLAINAAKTELAAITRAGGLIRVSLASGERSETALPKAARALEAAYLDDRLYVVADDTAKQPDQPPSQRHISLYRLEPNGEWQRLSTDQAQSAELLQDDADLAVLALDRVHQPGLRPQYRLINADAVGPLFSIPGNAQMLERLRQVVHQRGQNWLALIFGDEAMPPQKIVLANAKDLAPSPSNIQPLAASFGTSPLEPWRVVDPLRRAVLSVDENKLRLLPLKREPLNPLCPSLQGQAADAAAFSADGALLALSQYSDSHTRIYSTQTCSIMRDLSSAVRHNEQQMQWVGAWLWMLDDDGQASVHRIHQDFENVYHRAQVLVINN